MSAGMAPALDLFSGPRAGRRRYVLRRYLFGGASCFALAGYGFVLRGAGRGLNETFSIVRP
jgi:hypothetical protein